jgi:hypothetical protein
MRGQRSISQESYPDLKKGIKLPKSPTQWSNANDFFLTTVIYNYFSENYGFVDINNNKVFESKYKSASAKELKKVLKKLKLDSGNLMEIKFVAKKMRNRLRRADTDQQHC